MIRKVPIPRLKRQLDHLWRDVVLGRARVDGAPRCACCGELAAQAHHVFRKEQHGRYRYDLRNGLPLCSKDHRREKWDAAPMVVVAMDVLGQDFFDLSREVMASRGNGKHTWTRKELELIKAGLESLLSPSA